MYRNLHNLIHFRIQASHLEIDPYQRTVIKTEGFMCGLYRRRTQSALYSFGRCRHR